jgi:hypothetical protein
MPAIKLHKSRVDTTDLVVFCLENNGLYVFACNETRNMYVMDIN